MMPEKMMRVLMDTLSRQSGISKVGGRPWRGRLGGDPAEDPCRGCSALFSSVSVVCQGFTIPPCADASSITTRRSQHKEHQTLRLEKKLKFKVCRVVNF